MRRNSTYHQTLTPYILFFIAIIYESLATMTLYLTPLLGVGFYYIIHHIHDETRYRDFFLIVIYSLFVEINRNMIPFSFLFFTLIFYNLLLSSFKKYIHCTICLVISYVSIGYLGYFSFNTFLATIFHLPTAIFSWNYLLYILSDILFILVVL